MDRYTALVIIAAVIAIIVMVYLLIKFGIIHGKITTTTTSTTTTTTSTLPTTTPTTTPSSPPVVTVKFDFYGMYYSINLSALSGTTIYFSQGTDLSITGTAQPNQQITLTIYAPSGQQVYTTSVTAGSNGSFSMTVPTSSLSIGVKYKVVFSLGPDYFFYAVPV